jgi:16S rRNA (guanine527-N7)-methyltransferase
MTEESGTFERKLNSLLAEAALKPLELDVCGRFESYLSVLQRWNSRVNLSAIRDEDGVLSRHFVESIACAQSLPAGISSLLDFGSGAGFPGIPIAMCRPEISVTLAESQSKKASFLREAIRVLDLSAKVHSGRAQLLTTTFDCVALRAVDNMPLAVQAASGLVRSGGSLILLTTQGDLESLRIAAGEEFVWRTPIALPLSDERVIAHGVRG